MTDLRQISEHLENYGISSTEAKVYLFMLKNSYELSVVQIARALKLGRTPVYNALDRLEGKGLAVKVISSNGYNYSATKPDHLKKYWDGKVQATQKLSDRLDPIVAALESMSTGSGYQSQVSYFTGRRGLEQITYNSLRAEHDLYIYEVATDMSIFTDKNTAESFRETLVERQITTHQLTNHANFEPFTAIEQMIADLWDIRHIDPEILNIKFEMLIYNDVCALYSIENNRSFGVEIRNPNLASMQIQIFRAMQRLATPLEKIGINGEARLPQL